MPKISVCIPTYNGAGYLPGAVASVIAQTCSDYEIIVVDNDSSDETESVVQALQATYGNCIHYFRNTTNLGLAGNLNQCVVHARGAYIKLLCVDDLLMPECLELSLHALEVNPQVTLVTGARRMIDGAGKVLDTRSYAPGTVCVDGAHATMRCLYGSNYLGEPPAVLFRKRDFEQLDGGFKASLPQLMDMELWFRLLETGKLYVIGKELCEIRVHGGQLTQVNVKSGALVRDNITLFEACFLKLKVQASRRQRIKRRLLMTYRIWRCRSSFDKVERVQLLVGHGCRLMYPLMPLAPFVAQVIAFWRKRVS